MMNYFENNFNLPFTIENLQLHLPRGFRKGSYTSPHKSIAPGRLLYFIEITKPKAADCFGLCYLKKVGFYKASFKKFFKAIHERLSASSL